MCKYADVVPSNFHISISKFMPKLSIITICFNNNTGLRRTIDSVLPVLSSDVEYIIIDGGSTDGSRETIEAVADRLGYYCSEKDKGIYNAMNKGVAHAKGEYLLFLNSGDYLYSDKVIAEVLPTFDGTDIIYGNLIFLNPETGKEHLDIPPDKVNADTFFRGSLPHPATFIRRQLLIETPYNEQLKIVADWEFFTKKIVWEGCSTKHIPYIISVFIEDGISSTNKTLHDSERKECTRRLFTPAIIEVCYGWRALHSMACAEEMIKIGSTRKLHKRIRPLLRLIIRVNNFFSSPSHRI